MLNDKCRLTLVLVCDFEDQGVYVYLEISLSSFSLHDEIRFPSLYYGIII